MRVPCLRVSCARGWGAFLVPDHSGRTRALPKIEFLVFFAVLFVFFFFGRCVSCSVVPPLIVVFWYWYCCSLPCRLCFALRLWVSLVLLQPVVFPDAGHFLMPDNNKQHAACSCSIFCLLFVFFRASAFAQLGRSDPWVVCQTREGTPSSLFCGFVVVFS